MKTSFYFVLWMMIYPLLDIIPSQGVREYSFLVALVIVFGLSFIINKLMSSILSYENSSNAVSVMENIYTGNVEAFKRRLNRERVLETASSIYFILTVVFLIWLMFKTHVSNMFGLIIFGFLAIGAFARASKLIKASQALSNNPTPEECMNVAADVYGLDYGMYYQARSARNVEDMLPPRPKGYNAFLVISIIIATICAILGAVFVVIGICAFVTVSDFTGGGALMWIIYSLYGSLAAYYGIRDLISCIRQFGNRRSKSFLA